MLIHCLQQVFIFHFSEFGIVTLKFQDKMLAVFDFLKLSTYVKPNLRIIT